MCQEGISRERGVMAEEDRRNNDKEIVPGMEVEATEGDLGEQDVSPAKITKVEKDQQGNVEALEVSKGTLFRKKLDVRADRIQAVEPAVSSDQSSGKVRIDASEPELESLTAAGRQTLPPESERPQEDLLDQVEQ